MKAIALVVENYYPSMSGVPVVMQYLAEGLCKAGYSVDVLTGGIINGKRQEKNTVHNGVNIFRYYIKNTPTYRILGDPDEIDSFVAKACSDRYQCVIITCSQCWSTNLLLPRLKSISAKKIFYTHGFSGLSFGIDIKKGIKTFWGSLYRYVWMKYYYHKMPNYLKEFDSIVFISQNDSAKDFCERHHIEHGVVIDNAVEDCFFEEGYERPQEKKYLLNVSNYTYVKNQELLMEAFYAANTKDYALITIGSVETEYSRRLNQLKKQFEEKYGHKDVSICYGIERAKIHEYVRDASVFVMSSTWEQYSIALCEAMAEGIPFISTNVGNAAYLPGGIIANTKQEYINAISMLIEAPQKAKELGRLGNSFALKHNKREVAISSLISLIEE